MKERPRGSGFQAEPAVLDIGGEIGALILYTEAEYQGREVEVSPVDDDTARVHTVIHLRRMQAETVFAGVFPALRAGEYRIWTADSSLVDQVTIVGGAVAEVDWRTRH